jgi:2'-5' RNA ligase
MRLFVALDIDPEIRARISEFRDEMKTFAPDVRWVGPETFHVTLQFLGETARVGDIHSALDQVKPETTLNFRGTGFFPNPKSPRIFWIGIETDEHLQQLAASIGAALQPLGFERDSGPFKPHLTLARSGSGRQRPVAGERPAPGLQNVRARLETMPSPEFGTMTAREFCLYESKLLPSGAKYTKVARYPLE